MKISSTGDLPSNFLSLPATPPPPKGGGEWIREKQGINFIEKKQLKMK